MSGLLFRSTIFHTPRNPFLEADALQIFEDGGLLIEGDRIEAIGDFAAVHRKYPEALVHDWRRGFILPGFVDTHVHYPQLRVLGSLGRPLLDWLKNSALPEEARMADAVYARRIAWEFMSALASHGTTTALVFGAHFAHATEILFKEAVASGLRIASGLVLSDRQLLPELHMSPEEAYRQSTDLIRRYHGEGVRYVVTPRFALSTTEAMLSVCQALMRENPDVLFQSHMNENRDEVAEVARMFPVDDDYLAVYERFGLVGRRSVLAHNVHTSDEALARLAAADASVAHCPSSNASLKSGLFPMDRHIAAGVRVSLGTDVGAGTGFGMLKEGLQAYLLQGVFAEGYPLAPAHLLYLATRAGALAMGLEETGDLAVGHSADFVYLRPASDSVLGSVVGHADGAEKVLAALFTLGGSENVVETWVRGRAVYVGGE